MGNSIVQGELGGYQFGFLGCGNMGRALLAGWLDAGVVSNSQVSIAAKSTGPETAKRYDVEHFSLSEVVLSSHVLILALKPQYAAEVLATQVFNSSQLVISVMAGVETQDTPVSPARVVRVMPNLACAVGAGAAVAYAGADVTAMERRLVSTRFDSVGTLAWLNAEEQFHAGTALVGSGPAYIFLALEALSEAAVAQGLDDDAAMSLAIATVEGAAALAKSSPVGPDALRRQVTSPGGTTMAALQQLREHMFEDALKSAVKAASNRSKELSEVARCESRP